MKPFHFKQFSISQDKCAMKVSLDACLLGAICNVQHAHRILDIGTGTGLLSLMAAQRSHAHIDAIELDVDAAKQAQENVETSRFLSHIKVHHKNIKQYTSSNDFDVIICNPPFFSDHLKGPSHKRNLARHNDGLSFSELNQCLSQHLHADGRAWLLLPCSEFDEFISESENQNLIQDEKWFISSRPQKAPHRIVFSLKHNKKVSKHSLSPEKSISVHAEIGGDYTAEFKSLLADFYLKL